MMKANNHRVRRLASLIVAASLSAPGALRSQPAPPSNEVRAQQLANDGTKELDQNNFQRAIDLFTAADKLYPAPTLKVAIARAYIGQGRLLEAQKILLETASQPPQPGDKPHWPRVRADASARAAALTPRLAVVEIAVAGLPPGKTPNVTLDGEAVSAAHLSMPRAVNPGAHRVAVGAEGYRSVDQSFTLGEGQTRKVSVTLEPVAPAVGAVVEPGPRAEPTPRVEPTPAPPPAPPSAPSPPPRAQLQPLPPATTTEPPGKRGGSWMTPVGIGTTAAFGTAGIVTGLLALSKTSKVKDACPTKDNCPPSAQSDIDSARTLGTVSTVGFALAGAGAALTIYGLLSGRSDEPQVGQRPSLQVGLGPGSAFVGGRF